MAKQLTVQPEIPEVKCSGCTFIQPYEDFKGHGFCAHRAVKMVQIIETPKQCIWKQHGEQEQQKTSNITSGL